MFAIKYIGILFVIVVLSACTTIRIPPAIEAVEGVLDLTRIESFDETRFSLAGEWEFYFDQFIFPDEREGDTDERMTAFPGGRMTAYIDIPGSWDNIKENGRKLPPTGFATYRLRIRLPDNLKHIGIKLPTINTAYRLYINGRLKAEIGGVGRNPVTSKPKYEPQVILYQSDSNEIEMVLHVSNFHHQRSGITKNIVMGDINTILLMRENNKALELFFSGSIFIILIYNLWIFLWRRKEKAMLFFSIFSFLMLIRIFFHGENVILEWFPFIDWVLHYRIELISSFILPPVFCFFLDHLFPNESSRKICYISLLVTCIAGFIVVLIPSIHFASVFNVFQFVILITTLYVFIVIIRAVFRKRSGAAALLIGYLFFTCSIINDILSAQLLIQWGYLLPFGFFILSIFEFGIHINFVRAKDQLVRSENKIMALLNALPYPMIYFNSEGKILDYKIMHENLLLKEQTEIRGSLLYDLVPKDLEAKFKSIIAGKAAPNNLDVFEYTLEKNERVFYFEIRLMRGNEKTYLAIIQDITSSKITEQKLFEADKLAAIGTLVAGVAHEINNPNNSILLTADNLRDDFRYLFGELENHVDVKEIRINGDEVSEFVREHDEALERLKRNSLRIKKIVEDLKDFSSEKSKDTIENVDLHAVIDCAVQLLQNKIKNSTHHFSVVKGDIPSVRGNFQRFEQVFINLFQNACDSLEGKEKKITTKTSFNREEESIRIEISDEGIGMSSETQKRIFDPFFTTKKNTGGLGLGLSITYKIIKSCNGSLRFDSLPGEGTTAVITLPAAY
ncbi:MAG: PAS domain S-box protein [Spirochaetales bacterium]|nr:PAS domain S-box protein [Spirochaetales bacterium]